MHRALQVIRMGVTAVVVVFSLSAFAGDNDLLLSRLNYYDNSGCKWITPAPQAGMCIAKPNGQDNFENLVTELGIVMSPKLVSPAETLGEAGFELGFGPVFNTINNKEDYWQIVKDGAPDRIMPTLQIQARKGLPFGTEIGTTVNYLTASRMISIGGQFAASLAEGIWQAPDITLRGFGSRLTGAGELNLTSAGGDILIGKDFGLWGVGSIAPYLGYEFLWTNANTKLLDPSPGTLADGDAALISFNTVNVFANKFIIGARYKIAIVTAYVHVEITDQKMQVYSFKLATAF